MSSNIQSEITSMKPQMIEEIKREVESTLQDDVRKEIREIEDQKVRAMNLILFNVPESDEKVSEKRKDHDLKLISELCTILQIEKADIKTAFRLGNPSPKTSVKTWPLKLVFNNKKNS